MKQRQIAVPEKPAGKPSKEAPLVEPPKQQYYHYDMGDSEYKMKFKEWPLEGAGGVQDDENVGRRSGSLVFPTQAKDAYSRLRQSSSYRDSYPAYHHDEIAGSTSASAELGRGEPKPPSFAWSLLDGEAPKIPHEPRNNTNMGESEYNKKFKWPQGGGEAYAPPRTAHSAAGDGGDNGPTIGDTLFPVVEYASEDIKPLFSEYREQYYRKESAGELLRSPITTRRESGAPSQFAWPHDRKDGYDEEEDSPKARKLKPATGDWSEHTSKYKWITGDDHFLVKKADENHDRKIGQVFALDEDEGVRPQQWQSEYDAKMQLKHDSRHVSFVAGVPTATRAKVPSNFAWDESSAPSLPPPPSAVFKPMRKVGDAHFRSEYDEKFIPWRATPAEMIRPPPAAPELNIFEEAADPLQRRKDKQGTTTSEYTERFKQFASTVDAHPQGHGRADSNIPPQFAWPLGEEPAKPVSPPIHPSKPMERSIAETSFRWPTATVPTKSFKPEKDPHASIEPPMAIIDDSKDTEKWRSESRKQAQDILQAGSNVPHIAGIISVRDEDVPSFFAWADNEAKKKPTPIAPSRPAFLPVEAVNSEHREKFHVHPDAHPATLMKPTVQEKDLNLFAPAESDKAASKIVRSEYEDNFNNKPQSDIDGVAGKRATTQEFRPPQFAWPLVDPAASTIAPTVRKSSAVFKENSESRSKYNWPIISKAELEEAAMKSSKPAANTIDHFETTATLLDTDQGKSSQWRSEYGARNEDMRKRQNELLTAGKRTAAVQLKNHGMKESPAFFAWSALEPPVEQEAPAPLPPAARTLIAPDTSEYRDRFLFADTKMTASQPVFGISTKAMMDSSSHVGELLKNQPKKTMSSEYDAQFNLANAVQDEVNVPKIITRKDVIRPSLQHTNLDKHSAGEALLPPPPPFPPGTHVCTKKMELTTEASTQYKWPQTLIAPPQPATLGGAKANRHKGSDPNKENMSNTLNVSHLLEASTAPAPGKPLTRFQTGTTEYRKQFSWPEAARTANDVERERVGGDNMTDSTSPRKKGLTRQQLLRAKAKQYRLMSMKGARQPGILAQRSPGGAVLTSTFGRAERMPGDKKTASSSAAAAGLSTTNNKTTRRLMNNNTSGFDVDSVDRGFDDDYVVIDYPAAPAPEDRTDATDAAADSTLRRTAGSSAYSADSLDERKISSSQRSPVSIADDSARASSPGRLGEVVPYSTIPGKLFSPC